MQLGPFFQHLQCLNKLKCKICELSVRKYTTIALQKLTFFSKKYKHICLYMY